MTRKDYVRIAEPFRVAQKDAVDATGEEVRVLLVDLLCCVLAQDNANFDVGRFRAACNAD